MINQGATPVLVVRYSPAKVVALDRWREMVAGVCIVIGLTWPFLFSSLVAIPWWSYTLIALFGGALRYRKYPHEFMPQVPMVLFVLVMLIYSLMAVTLIPMPSYGSEKVLRFILLGGAAYLFTFRQAPLTEHLDRGMRWALAITLLMSLGVTYLNREMFLDTQKYGMAEMRQLFAVTGFPLSVALASVWVIPRSLRAFPIFLGSILLLMATVLEIFIRGRFAAITLGGMAIMLLLGPPWRSMFARVVFALLLAGACMTVYLYLLPSFGDSYQYLEGLLKHPMENRDILYTVAWRGFMAHPMGLGIGSFADNGMLDYYPHNVFLEVGYELGLPGMLAVVTIYAVSLRRIWKLWMSPPHRMLAALLMVVLLYMLKAGDIATWVFQWVFLYMLVVATPIAPTWPLLRGEALQ